MKRSLQFEAEVTIYLLGHSEPDPEPPTPLCGTTPPFGAWSYADQAPSRPVVQQPVPLPVLPPQGWWGLALRGPDAQQLINRVKGLLDLTNEQLAARVGVNVRSVGQWSRGAAGMTHPHYQAILALLEVDT